MLADATAEHQDGIAHVSVVEDEIRSQGSFFDVTLIDGRILTVTVSEETR
jgi:hypothetical protein